MVHISTETSISITVPWIIGGCGLSSANMIYERVRVNECIHGTYKKQQQKHALASLFHGS